MCVTSGPAEITGTRTYVYATYVKGDVTKPVHVCGYQNKAASYGGGPNCMFLNFAGTDLALVRGPERTTSFMDDMTRNLPSVEPVPVSRGMVSFGMGAITVEDYGDYTMILAQGTADILSALERVPFARRPLRTPELEVMVAFYMSVRPQDSFGLACFDNEVNPQHPITVSYKPRDPSVLTIPGLEGHDGTPPVIGAPVYRDFRVAFAAAGKSLHPVSYGDRLLEIPLWWAPSSVVGFHDNRRNGPNGDYVLPLSALRAYATAGDVVKELVA